MGVGVGVGVGVGAGLSDGVGEGLAVGAALGLALGDRLGRGGLGVAVTTRPVGLGPLEGVEVELRWVEALGVAVGASDGCAWLRGVGVGATGRCLTLK